MKVFVTAGEASGDKLGAALMAGLRALRPDVQFFGVGGPRMMAEGLESLFPMEELSVMGLVEILKQYRHLKGRIRQTAQAVLDTAPDVLITIDAPEFSLRLNKLVRAQSDLRIVHYVAPTVWAWRPGRAQKMAAHVDHVLALLPFEPPYMQAAGIDCDFVGHPVVTDPQATATEAEAFRTEQGIAGPIALMLPGSRRSELARLMPVFQEVAQQLIAARPDLTLVLPAAGHVAEQVRETVSQWPVPVRVIDPKDDPTGQTKRAAFRAADVAVAASGTVSLELAAADTPMVIAYDMGWLSRQIIGRMLRVDTVTLVNLVSDTRVIPEFIGANSQPAPITEAALAVLQDPEAQRAAMALTMQRLGKDGPPPGQRAAKAVLRGLGQAV